MCGRLEVNKSVVDTGVFNTHHILFHAINNLDLRPSEFLACLHYHRGSIAQTTGRWGIQPKWAHHPMLNQKPSRSRKRLAQPMPCIDAWYLVLDGMSGLEKWGIK